jgi:hypothetical protein
MKTRLEIIQETQDTYSDPRMRAIGAPYCGCSACHYLHPDGTGRMCAVGRCMKSPGSAEGESWVSKLAEDHGGLDILLKDEYTGHPLDFWTQLQRFHDRNQHFDSEGITPLGLAYLAQLRKDWA